MESAYKNLLQIQSHFVTLQSCSQWSVCHISILALLLSSTKQVHMHIYLLYYKVVDKASLYVYVVLGYLGEHCIRVTRASFLILSDFQEHLFNVG